MRASSRLKTGELNKILAVLSSLSWLACGSSNKATSPKDAAQDVPVATPTGAEAGPDLVSVDAAVEMPISRTEAGLDMARLDAAGEPFDRDSSAAALDAGIDQGGDLPAQQDTPTFPDDSVWDVQGVDGLGNGEHTVDRALDTAGDLVSLDGIPDADFRFIVLVITPSTSPIDLGQVDKGRTGSPTYLTITNIGLAASGKLTLSASDPQLVLSDDRCTGKSLASAAGCEIAVALSPTQTGMIAGTITADDGAAATVSAATVGIGLPYYLLAAAPPSFDFGTQFIWVRSPPQTFTIVNTGILSSGALAVTLDHPELAKGVDTCDGVSLAPDATCTVDVVFDTHTCEIMNVDAPLVITPKIGTPLSIELKGGCTY